MARRKKKCDRGFHLKRRGAGKGRKCVRSRKSSRRRRRK